MATTWVREGDVRMLRDGRVGMSVRRVIDGVNDELFVVEAINKSQFAYALRRKIIEDDAKRAQINTLNTLGDTFLATFTP